MGRYRTPDPAGLKFNRWTVLERLPHTDEYQFHWRCRCECGTVAIVYAPNVKRGLSKSCGCLFREVCGENTRTHGRTNTPEYETWCGMKKRCYNTRTKCFPNYGGRGIRVCDRWLNDFGAFIADVGLRPSPEHSLDRFPNNDGNYEPGNVRWATGVEQHHNRRPVRPFTRKSNVWLEHNGERLTATEWERRLGFRRGTIQSRLRDRGWSVDRALNTPVER